MSKEESEEVDVPSADEMFGSVEVRDMENIREHNDRVYRYHKEKE